MLFDKEELHRYCKTASQEAFLKRLKTYDEQMVPVMKARGYKCIQSSERTVAFVSVGEVTFKRRRWKKGNAWCIPVDEALQLPKHIRYSEEMMQVIAKCALVLPYEKAAAYLRETYEISISRSVVHKAVKWCANLLKEREDYRFYKEGNQQKEAVPVIYVEGDGVFVKSKQGTNQGHGIELSHFVIHTGTYQKSKTRTVLQNKHEIINIDNRIAREQVIDYIYNTYDITEDTLLITNSDGGRGYTPYVFKEMAKALKVKHHEHFWDAYHVTQTLKSALAPYDKAILDLAFQAINVHKRGLLKTVFETVESLEEDGDKLEMIHKLKQSFLKQFHYIKPAALRGLTHQGIGIMESQHRKVTYRTKRRGMYWTLDGISTISNLILLADENKLDDFFKGEWRKEYEKIKALDHLSADSVRPSNQTHHQLPKAKHYLTTKKRD